MVNIIISYGMLTKLVFGIARLGADVVITLSSSCKKSKVGVKINGSMTSVASDTKQILCIFNLTKIRDLINCFT